MVTENPVGERRIEGGTEPKGVHDIAVAVKTVGGDLDDETPPQ
ncbi:hypothetical protein [Natrinema halophilum]|nr:hypothetical protein [Natrinema halophilum]